jgi:hypothetical protein
MEFDHRQLALIVARGRAINGLVMLAVPGLIGRSLMGKEGGTSAMRAAIRLVGVRDLVLGVGAITTLKERTMDAEWVGMGAVADGVDAVVALTAPGLPLRSRLITIVGGGAAALGLLAARALADERNAAQSEVDS